MNDKNCELLFEYLRSILYDSSVQKLDISELDESHQKLGKGLQYLDHAVQEMKSCSAALSNGNLSAFTPSRDNPLCENLKNIHANLNHLTWQAKQVAKGDYSQNVSYLGEFSGAFNTMTEQLREREQFLKKEAQMQKDHAAVVENYNKLLLTLIRNSQEDILVSSIADPHILYSSRDDISSASELYHLILEHRKSLPPLEINSDDECIWETEDSSQQFYRITTMRMEWQGEPAYAHILLDVTQEKLKQGKLEQEANFDRLTGIGNRYYFHKKMKELLEANTQLVFCYCDLDHLKYVNDTYGHAEGDWYLCHFVETVKKQIRDQDLFVRLGGDEFCLILKNCPMETARRKLYQIQTLFSEETTHPYEKSFSFGITQIPAAHGTIDLDTMLQQADQAMYDQKRAHKQMRS